MKKKSAVAAPRKDALEERYGQIKIPALAAAARYQSKGKNKNENSEGSRAEGSKPRKGASPDDKAKTGR